MKPRATNMETPAPPTSLGEVVEGWARRTPQAMAVLDRERSYTYAELVAAARSLMRSADALELTGAQRVALIVDDTALSSLVLHALSARVPVLPVTSAIHDVELSALLDLAEIRLLVCLTLPSEARLEALARHGVRVWQVRHDLRDQPIFVGPAAPKGAAELDACLLMPTSGTTGTPRIVPLTRGGACEGARVIARALELKATDRCLNLCSLSHVSGQFMAVFSSWTVGGSVICVPDIHRPDVLAAHQGQAPNWLCSVPTMLERLVALESASARALRLDFVHCGTALLHPDTQTEIERVFGAPVVHSYGMTETLMISCTPREARSAKEGTVGFIQQSIRIIDERGEDVAPGELGQIVILNNLASKGYLGEPPFAAEFATGDLARLDGDGHLTVVGRIKDMISRGGKKIAPAEIDDVLMRHPAVLDACCFGYADPVLGEEIAAAVVLDALASATERELRDHVAQHVSRHKVPKRVIVVDEIPRTQPGKKKRSAFQRLLREQLAAASTSQHDPARKARLVALAPAARRAALTEELCLIAASYLGSERVEEHEELVALGLDSVGMVRLAQEVSLALDVSVSLTHLFRHPTCHALAEAILEQFEQRAASDESAVTASDRPLGYTETNFVNALERNGSGIVVEAVVVRGPLTRDGLEQAVRALTAREPLLQVHLAGSGFQRRFQTHDTQPVPITWSQLARAELSATTDELVNQRTFGERSPLLEVYAYELLGESRTFALCLRVHHGIADAGNRLTEELLHLLAAHAEQRSLLTPPRKPLAPAEQLVAASRIAGAPWRSALKYVQNVLRQDFLPMARVRDPRRTATLRAALTPSEMSVLEERARGLGITPYTILTSCLLCAIREEIPKDGAAKLSLMSFVDLRPHYTPSVPPGGLGFHVSALLTQHRVPRDADPEALASEIGTATSAAYRKEGALRMFDLSAHLLRLAVRHPRLSLRTTVLSTSATDTFAALGATVGPFELLDLCCSVGTHGVGACITFVMQDFQGGLRCILGYPDPLVQPALAERVAAGFMNHVRTLLNERAAVLQRQPQEAPRSSSRRATLTITA